MYDPLPLEIKNYYQNFPEAIQERLFEIRNLALSIFGECEEGISYGLPTFKKNKKNLFHYGAFKNHIGWYPGAKGVEYFISKHPEYSFSKGCIQIQNFQNLDLIALESLLIFLLENQKK